jgi:hypothetical protein
MSKKLIIILLISLIYTIVRYIIFGNVSLIQIPVYLVNKSVAMASVSFMFFAALNYKRQKENQARFWGKASLHSTIMHILLSLAILSKDYYPKFFATQKMNLTGELTIMFGVIATCFFLMTSNDKTISIGPRLLQFFAVLFVLGHLLSMGLGGWLAVDEWNGGLPPISLISFILATINLVLLSKRDG